MVLCTNGHECPDTQLWCGYCGTGLGWMCPNGHHNPAINQSCSTCGPIAQWPTPAPPEPRPRAAVVASKNVNAFIPDATVDLGFMRTYFNVAGSVLMGNQIEATIRSYAQKWGGLWVGGQADLTTEYLQFRPNSANKSVHSNDCSLDIPLAALRSVTVQKAPVTSIVVNETEHGPFKIRCVGAARFADLIRAQADQARRNQPPW